MIRVDAKDALLHDLRNALGLLVGLAANLRDGLDGPVNDVQRAHAQRIVEVGVDAGAMLERLASADAHVDPAAAFDLGALARSIVGRFDAQAAARGLRVTVSVDGDDVVTGDRLVHCVVEYFGEQMVKPRDTTGDTDGCTDHQHDRQRPQRTGHPGGPTEAE